MTNVTELHDREEEEVLAVTPEENTLRAAGYRGFKTVRITETVVFHHMDRLFKV